MQPINLRSRASFDVPLSEISGLGQRPVSPEGPGQVLAVGDEDFTVVAAAMSPSPKPGAFSRHELRSALNAPDPTHGSEWEAADGDSSGRVFILQESPGAVFVLSPELDRLLHTIELSLETDEALDWTDNPNAQGEGLVLLQNGHVLIAKEKDPPMLLEFGPRGAHAEGVGPGLLLMGERRFPLGDGDRSEQVLLSAWNLDMRTDEEIDDISDVAVGPDERLYLLSDESRCIARLEHALPPEDRKLSITCAWSLPEEIVQPEGLVLLDDLTPLVAIDKQERERNLFVLDPLEG